MTEYAEWYREKFGKPQPQWYLFPFGKADSKRSDPARDHPQDRLENVRKNAKVKGRWHDNRHTLITDLAESGAGDQTIMDIAGHVSKQMLKHYSHIRMQAKETPWRRSSRNRPMRKPPMGKRSAEGHQQGPPQGC